VVDVAGPGGDTRTSAANGILSTLNSGTTTPGAEARNGSLTPDQVETHILRGGVRGLPAADPASFPRSG